MAPDPEIYGPVIVSVFLLGLTWLSFGLDGLSNNLFLISLYSIFVPSLFFTFGALIEKMVVKKQIDRVVKQVETTSTDLNYDISDVNIPPASKEEDQQVKDQNTKTVQDAYTVMAPIFGGGIVLSYILWRNSKKRISYKFIIFSNILLLILIAIIEMLFFGLITLNYRSLDTNMIARTTLTSIGKKLKG